VTASFWSRVTRDEGGKQAKSSEGRRRGKRAQPTAEKIEKRIRRSSSPLAEERKKQQNYTLTKNRLENAGDAKWVHPTKRKRKKVGGRSFYVWGLKKKGTGSRAPRKRIKRRVHRVRRGEPAKGEKSVATSIESKSKGTDGKRGKKNLGKVQGAWETKSILKIDDNHVQIGGAFWGGGKGTAKGKE